MSVFKGKEVERLQSEVEYLRGLVKELTDKLMALTGEAYVRYAAEKRMSEPPVELRLQDMVTGRLETMEAKTPEEILQKNQAAGQINAMFGGNYHG